MYVNKIKCPCKSSGNAMKWDMNVNTDIIASGNKRTEDLLRGMQAFISSMDFVHRGQKGREGVRVTFVKKAIK